MAGSDVFNQGVILGLLIGAGIALAGAALVLVLARVVSGRRDDMTPSQRYAAEQQRSAPLTPALPPGDFDVILTGIHDNRKIQVIKVLRETTNLGLKEAKDLAEAYPGRPVVVSGISEEAANQVRSTLEEAANQVRSTLEEAGATVEVKSKRF